MKQSSRDYSRHFMRFYLTIGKLEFQESDVSPGKTEVKQGKFVEFISPTKIIFRETYQHKT